MDTGNLLGNSMHVPERHGVSTPLVILPPAATRSQSRLVYDDVPSATELRPTARRIRWATSSRTTTIVKVPISGDEYLLSRTASTT